MMREGGNAVLRKNKQKSKEREKQRSLEKRGDRKNRSNRDLEISGKVEYEGDETNKRVRYANSRSHKSNTSSTSAQSNSGKSSSGKSSSGRSSSGKSSSGRSNSWKKSSSSGRKTTKKKKERGRHVAFVKQISSDGDSKAGLQNDEGANIVKTVSAKPLKPALKWNKYAKTNSMNIPSLQVSLMRSHNKDPFENYVVVCQLGTGSMGSVCKVKKKKTAVGGSARKTPGAVLMPKRIFPCLSFCFPCDDTNAQEESKLGPMVSTEGFDFEDPLNIGSFGSNVTMVSDNDSTCGNPGTKSMPQHSTMVSFKDDYVSTYALKTIVLDHVASHFFLTELYNEIAILRSLDHPNICKAIETFEFKNQVYLVLELCSGGDLYSRDPYDECQAKHIVHSIVDACRYLHLKNITHRDREFNATLDKSLKTFKLAFFYSHSQCFFFPCDFLVTAHVVKFENIMFASPASANVKIIDFGLSKKYFHNETMNHFVGTIYTMAPEVIMGNYDHSCDVWSIGVLAFMLLSSQLPFYGTSKNELTTKITKGKFRFKNRKWKNVSHEAKDFVTSLLVVDVKNRPSCSDALSHEWFNGYIKDEHYGYPNQLVCTAVMDRVQATLQAFAGYSKLKKLALIVIAHKSSNEEVGFLQQLFQHRFDVEKDGVITLDEFKISLAAYSYTDEELEDMFNAVDMDGDGDLSYSEFLAATIEAHGTIEEDRIAEAFDRLDHDDSGYITVENLMEFLGREVSEEEVHEIISQVDNSEDHRIDYEEFLGLWDGSFDDILGANLLDVQRKRMIRENARKKSLE